MSSSTCLVFECEIRLILRCTTLRLSHHKIGVSGKDNFSSLSNDRIHTISVATKAKHRYSTSVLDLEMIDCFFEPQAIKFPPRKT